MENENKLVDVAGVKEGEEGIHRQTKVAIEESNSLSASLKQERKQKQGSVPHPYHWVFQILSSLNQWISQLIGLQNQYDKRSSVKYVTWSLSLVNGDFSMMTL